MLKVRFHQINYDIDHTDSAAKDLDLPKEITAEFNNEFDPAMEGADFISDETGFCVNGFQFDIIKMFNVSVPVVVNLNVEVDAGSKTEAMNKVLDELEFDCKFESHTPGMVVSVNEAEHHRRIVTGNVYHGCINEISAEEV